MLERMRHGLAHLLPFEPPLYFIYNLRAVYGVSGVRLAAIHSTSCMEYNITKRYQPYILAAVRPCVQYVLFNDGDYFDWGKPHRSEFKFVCFHFASQPRKNGLSGSV